MKMGILFGGSSFEHEISIVSAITMKKVLKDIELVFIYVDDEREFYHIGEKEMNSDFFSKGLYKKNKKVIFKSGEILEVGLVRNKILEMDAVLNIIHGRDGEDGKISAILDFYRIPSISPSMEASVYSYSKLNTKYLAEIVGVKTLGYQVVNKGDKDINIENFPVIIKPVHLGSSIGITIVENENELDYAIDIGFEFDDQLIIEPYLDNVREYNKAGVYINDWKLSITEEPKKDGFLGFDEKYLNFSQTNKVVGATITKKEEQEINDNFKKIYSKLFKGSLIRCDFFIIDGVVYLNEINAVPGSMAHYLFNGNFEGLIKGMIKEIRVESKIRVDFDYINKLNGSKTI